jgi:hypothetical protein
VKIGRLSGISGLFGLVAVASPLALACDREPPRPERPPEAVPVPVASVAKALGVDAGELEPAVDPPAAAGDLQAEIQGFTSVEACVEQRAHLDPLLGDALEAIGYDTFVRDACRVLDAAKAGDAGRCDAIDASSLRRQCVGTVAASKGDADLCPWNIPSRPEGGRDTWCLAMAARDPRLCAARETMGERVTCDATVRHDPAPCAKLPVRAEQARCTRDVDRWRHVTPAPDASLASLPAVEGTLHLEPRDDHDAGAPVDTNLSASLGRGVVVIEPRDGARFELGSASLSLSGPSFIAASPHTTPTFAAALFAGADGKRVTVERVELSVPGHAPLATPLAHSTITATVDKLEPKRGAPLSVTLEGDLGDSTGSFHVRLKATTFVRDVVTARALYAARSGAGAAGAGVFGGAGLADLLARFGDAGLSR